jgi:hypothetical protein
MTSRLQMSSATGRQPADVRGELLSFGTRQQQGAFTLHARYTAPARLVNLRSTSSQFTFFMNASTYFAAAVP